MIGEPDVNTEGNSSAFLSLLSWSEGTNRAADPYRVCYGYRHTIIDLREHPAVTGEWRGEALPDHMCKAAGFGPGCVSTAAGRYQLIRPTWACVRNRLRLNDFGPESQDRAALYLIEQRGALEDVMYGRIKTAIQKCKPEWASLPGAGYGQPERGLDDLMAHYVSAGGSLA